MLLWPYELDQNGIAGVKLRPVENGTACQFMNPEGCGVYGDRPTACRYDIDTFRSFVASKDFTSLHDLPAEKSEKFRSDDTALMLFCEISINLKKKLPKNAVNRFRKWSSRSSAKPEKNARRNRMTCMRMRRNEG
jgi:hypothetical protein